MTKVAISIVMSTYNDGDYISQSIESVIRQTFTDWELIIINDASTDNTSKIICKYLKKEKRIRYFYRKKNRGLIANLNKGLEVSKGKLIARIDSDDYWIDRDKLKKQYKFMKNNPDYGLVGTWCIAISENGDTISDIKRPVTDKNIRKSILIENSFVHTTVMFRKKQVEELGFYDPCHTYIEDYGLWLKLGKVTRLYNIPEKMIKFRIKEKGHSQSNYLKFIKAAEKLIYQFRNDYPSYNIARLVWFLRRYYPYWFRAYTANKLKERILMYKT